MPFRFQARSAFLTFPQCPMDKKVALEMLQRKLGTEEGTHYIVAQEKHEDGHLHLHIYVERKKMIETTNERFFDLADDKVYHPNIQVPKQREDVKKYVKKDGDYIKWPEDWEEDAPAAKRGKWAEATPALLEGQDTEALLKRMPEFVLGNLKKVQEAVAFLANIKAQEDQLPLQEFLTWEPPGDIISNWSNAAQTVWRFLKDNLTNKGFGRRQLYLHGGTGIGKSTFLQHLIKCVRTYHIPVEDFYDHWNDNLYDLSVMEEFKSQKTIQWLNQWLDGAIMNVRKKGVAGVMKKNPIPTIILSNFDIHGSEVYPNMQESTSLQTLRRRLYLVYVDKETMHQLTAALRSCLEAFGKPLPPLPPPAPEQPQWQPGLTLTNGFRGTTQTVNPLWRGEAEH